MTALFPSALAVFAVAAVSAIVVPRRARTMVTGMLSAVAGGLAAVAGVAAMTGNGFSAWLPDVFPLFGIRLELDALGGLFVAVTGAVAVCASVFGIGYGRHGLDGSAVQALLPLFCASMLVVPAAASVATLLVAWELMAVTSLLLVLAEHSKRAEVRAAGWWYAWMTHAGLIAVMVGLLVLASAAGSGDFVRLRDAEVAPGTASVVFCLTAIGFASKAGIVPLHVWLPRAHPEAPSHVSALMSAAMVNLGVYGVLRVGFDLLGGGVSWWWLAVGGAGAVSALYGILQAAVSRDLKRLLGFSTTENMGLVLMGVGAAGFLSTTGSNVLAGVAMVAALLHVVNHAGFKTLLFSAAGSVVHATGTRDLDALGGLRSRMPVTTACFAVGALCAAALPPGNAFVSEWLLLQSFIQSFSEGGVASAVAMPLAVGVLALSAGLAVATFVKAFGTGFLAKPRSNAASWAREATPSMRTGMLLAAGLCVLLAVGPELVLPQLSAVAAAAMPGSQADIESSQWKVEAASSSISPLVILLALAIAMAVTAALLSARRSRRARRTARLWDCGGGPMTSRMEYNATSFAEPLQRVFNDVLAPESDVNVTPVNEIPPSAPRASAYLIDSVTVTHAVPDRIEARWYLPVVNALRRFGRAAGWLGNGSIHRYLAYGFLAFIAALIFAVVY